MVVTRRTFAIIGAMGTMGVVITACGGTPTSPDPTPTPLPQPFTVTLAVRLQQLGFSVRREQYKDTSAAMIAVDGTTKKTFAVDGKLLGEGQGHEPTLDMMIFQVAANADVKVT